MPPRSVPQHVPDCIKALLAQHFYEAGDTSFIYLSQRFEVRGRGVHRWDFLYPAAWSTLTNCKNKLRFRALLTDGVPEVCFERVPKS